MNDIARFYNKFSEKQRKAGINHRHLSIQRMLKASGLKRNHRVLEIGCGIGTLTTLLLRFLTKGHVHAIDISPTSIEIARDKLAKNHSNVDFSVSDITQDPISGNYDVVVLPDVLEHIPIKNHKSLFKKIDQHLQSDGFVFIHIPEPHYLKWVSKTSPEELQIIDQPLFTSDILKSLVDTPFYLDYLKTYSIYNLPADYQVLILRKANVSNFISNPKPPVDPIFCRIRNKLNI